MTLNPRLQLRTQQRLAITPDIRLRLDLLRMGPAELSEALASEAARNPFLLFDPPATAPRPTIPVDTVAAPPAPFQHDLYRQIERQHLAPGIEMLARRLIAELRADGYLDADLESLAEETGTPLAAVEAALTALQTCEPAGIAARSVAECLTLQLVDQGLDRDAAEATLALLPDFARRDWAGIGAALGLDRAEVLARAALLRGLSAQPIRDPDAPDHSALSADLRLQRDASGALRIEPVTSSWPSARLDLGMVQKAATDGFAAELLARARALLAALEQRGRTLERIGGWLVENQAGFLRQGVSGLRPATRIDLAAALSLHPSTISRALAGKAIDIDGRLWPLGVFFSSALPARGGPVSSRSVQRRIAELIAAEAPGQPLSDESLAGLLREQGVDIARRTVAKYRQGLRIPSSSARRKLSASRRRE
ncbi:MAG: hypothetical protein KDK12_05010 [Rhodobacteraceae bacterium]|nr:hypothetical protein [Paracoccaceae bacterium]